MDTTHKIRDFISRMAGSLVSERELASRFKLTRSHARETLLTLEGEGLVRRLPQRGYACVSYENTDHETVNVLRYAIERQALTKAARMIRREDVIRLTLSLEAMDRLVAATPVDGDALEKEDMAFHEAIIRASRDLLLIRMFDFLKYTVFFVRLPAIDNHQPTQEGHRLLFQALKDGDAARCHSLLARHLFLEDKDLPDAGLTGNA